VRVAVAVPVASPVSVKMLSRRADEVFSLLQPKAFFAVGQFCTDFGQVSDDEVKRLLAAGAKAPVK
jgi:putative phosphoribosyl transferase